MMQVDLTAIGGGIGMVLSGIVGWFGGKGRRQVGDAENSAAISGYKADSTVLDASASQITQLLERVTALETKYSSLWDELQAEKRASSKLRDRVNQLEGILRANNIPVPAES